MNQRLMSEMVRNRRPVTVGPETTVADACRVMQARRIGAVLVTDDEAHLKGIFTGRDAVRLLANGVDPHQPVSGVMTAECWSMKPGSTAIDALRLMEDGGFRHVPVVEDGRVVGIVSWGDFRDAEHDRIGVETDYWERI
jgi:CBS domain-containing protein